MNNMKRFFAGLIAVSFMASSNISGITAIAEEIEDMNNDTLEEVTDEKNDNNQTAEELRLEVKIPDGWTNSINNWDLSVNYDDVAIYYKTSHSSLRDEEWGSYKDGNTLLWNDGSNLQEGEGFIKYWAVKTSEDNEESVESDAVHYQYDKTIPNAFSLEKKDTGNNRFVIKNTSQIKDELSQIDRAYYIIDPKNNESDREIEIELKRVHDGFDFEIECTKEMNKKTVVVYVIDKAGNIQISSIGIDTYKDLSAPSLRVNGIKNQWVNDLSEWEIRSDSPGARIYYKVSESEPEDWGTYTDSEVLEWNSFFNIPEGEQYIHFWAAYDDVDREVAEQTKKYFYDCTVPEKFSLRYEHKGGAWFQPPVFKIYGSDIKDSVSGINTKQIGFRVNNEWDRLIDPNLLIEQKDGSYEFVLDLSNESWLTNVNVDFFITDNAGNRQTSFLSKDKLTYDSTSPVIFTDEKRPSVVSAADSSALLIKSYEYGSSELNNSWKAVYSSNEYYLKLVVQDNDLREIVVKQNEGRETKFTENGENNSHKWISEKKHNNDEVTYYLKISDIGLSANEICSLSIIAKDSQNSSQEVFLSEIVDKEEVKYSVWYDPFDDKDSVINFKADNYQKINNIYYYGKDFEDIIQIDLSDDNGIKAYSVDISGPDGFQKNTGTVDLSLGQIVSDSYEEIVELTDEDGNPKLDSDGNVVTETVTKKISYYIPYDKYSIKQTIDNSLYKTDGKYVVSVTLEDLAGNSRTNSFEFYLDTTSPEVTNEKYSYNPSILHYLSFGIFGNDTIDISVDVADNGTGCGVKSDSVSLKWNGNIIKGKLSEEHGVAKYTFEKLPVGGDSVPYITVMDLLGNTSNYYFTTEDNKLARQNDITSTHLVLENIKPNAEIILPENNKYIINGDVWYPAAFDYSISAEDKDSGLSRVFIKENQINSDNSLSVKSDITENGVDVEGTYVDFDKMKDRYISEAIYKYHIEEEGNYQIEADVCDNAGNNLSDPEKSNTKIQIVHVDKTNPEITEFMFSGENDSTTEMERGTYGFYFKNDTVVNVYVKDDGNSSGIDYVTLYRKDISGKETSTKIYSSDSENYHSENGVEYASFVIEKGFKGQVWALVADKVAAEDPAEDNYNHTSGLRYADGSIVEDEEMHNAVSDIIITENIGTDKKDADGIDLYNGSIPLTVNVKDTFSGISSIEWTIVNDGTSGIISIENDGSYHSDSNLAVVDESSIEKDSNLITNLSFNITVTSNTNNNEVQIKMSDRSKNESSAKKNYSIDTTSPSIVASLSNTSPSNERYYNTDQTVTISVTERNFNSEKVKFMINGNERVIENWSSSGSGDSTVNTGSFKISDDGNYSYNITFEDMAGNSAEPFSQDMFVIDQTLPVLTTNFDEFKTDKDNHYFGTESINKTARITIVEHNFSPQGANVVVQKKESGSEHSLEGMNERSVYGWNQNGDDEYVLEIPFKSGDDGIYNISVTPVDLASNAIPKQETVIFEIDFTNPVISERNGQYVKDEEKSYSNLEVYNENTGLKNDFVPSVLFEDKNFDHIEYDLTVYTPEYKNEKEIGDITPYTEIDSTPEKLYSLPEFKKDGVYSFDLTAVDKAGNRSKLCKNTSVLMMEEELLAYISNSNKNEGTGWYSIQKDEDTPISKRPDSFKDLDITVFVQEGSETRIILRDENGEPEDTLISAENSDDIYAVEVYNYKLPKEYFVDNYPEGTNKDLYLLAENTINDKISYANLGWIRIDALAPNCTVPSDLKNWKSYTSNQKTVTLSGITESLDPSKCIVYDNGKAMSQNMFNYSDESDTLSYTLDKGWHDISFILVDEAGNAYTVQEISSVQVGLFYCLWFRIICGLAIAGIIAAVIVLIRKKRKSVKS